MKKFRLENSHLMMLGVIVFGILTLGYLLLRSPGLYLVLVLLSATLVVGLLFYQKTSYELTEQEQLERLQGQTEQNLAGLLEQMPVGVVQFDDKREKVVWFNPYAALVLTKEDGDFDAQRVLDIFQAKQEAKAGSLWLLGDKKFTVTVDKTRHLLYFWDTYSPVREVNELTDFSPVIAVVSVDNYDEITDSLADAEVSQINGFVANFIADFTSSKKIFYRRADMDRFYLFTDYFVLSDLIQDKFSVLDRFRQEAKERDLALTLSMGIAYGNHDHQDIGRVAQNNLNMAMVRGGDQVVLKANDPDKDFQYFGGGSNSTVKRSRTRTRAMMSAISDKIRLADRVFVVGHRNLDMDALASSVGMQFFASQIIGHSAYAVYDPHSMSEDVGRAIERLASDERTKLLTVDAARTMVTRQSLLIMVDHSKISLTLSEPFYRQFVDVIVVDHHRRDDDFPTNASLSFIESGASSASELVTELIQFQNAKTTISRLQASVLMAGIMLDTKNFASRVTSRTFDVASYLRRNGSDSQDIQDISAQSFEDYRRINRLILSGEPMAGNMIIATGQDRLIYSNVVAAKAADTLLNMAGIEASFVITRTSNQQVAISARSKQAVNVQRLMERLGGGGHFNLAACQLSYSTVEEAKEQLLKAIDEDMTKPKE